MTSDRRRPRPPRNPALAPLRQARYWDRRYISDPEFFGSEPSRFLRWTLARIRAPGPNWLELGSGYGRDLVALRERGFSVRGVDVSRVGTTLARRAKLAAIEAPALEYLPRLDSGSVDVVYSNLFLNMEFTEEEHERLFAEVHRVLAPGGYHAYSVRSVADQWYGRGPKTGPDSFDLAPDGPVLHFFSREYARRLRHGRFRCVRVWEGTEGREFPISVLYTLERKPRAGR
ncbi:MAG TPA: class I SAM-dependent methyltransferase [Thermoplasmata archaeon]|nr:class I SAM-dependent methyltransferase [Thermoplasmata archaeon]